MDRPETPFAAAARPGRRIGHAVELHDSIGSTSDRARELLDVAGGAGTAVVAELQTHGRGRRGRTWTSPPGRNLAVSVAVRPRIAASEAWRLGMAVAMASRDACRTVAPVDLKWPNDLVAGDGRKLGGLLIETEIDGERVSAATIGIGINVNWAVAEMPAEIAGSATSLAELTAGRVDRGALLAALLDRLDTELAELEAGGSPLERYRAACRTLGSEVTVEVGSRAIHGLAVAIDDAGALVVETRTGRETVTSGEVVRVRPAVPA
ncbi:MAG TPA: biotin--[acetyl-CoA-carboxylase] ligase [Patescibacteria group bacterium]|nr:biotin--[acetyl-CoA-carboxylase] ligase [Patescibacteria group bacterium]